jgi:alkylation response protein AidB-like acyl-CoA dehydrogenase
VDFALTEEQTALAELARTILSEQVTHERLKTIEATDDRFDAPLWRTLADANLLGTIVPESHGGLGYGLEELSVVIQECGRALPAVPHLASMAFGTTAVVELGSTTLQGALLPGVATGETILTAALVEPGGGSATDPASTARRDGDDWVLDGVKVCVPWASTAARVIVPATTGEGRTGLFAVAPDAPGVTLERTETTTRDPQFTMILEDVRVHADAVLGDVDGDAAVRRWTDVCTALLCSFDLGVAEAALQLAADYDRERHQFDVPIGSFQAVHQRLADCWIDVMAIRLTAQQAIWRLSERLPADDELAFAKYWASSAAFRVTRAAVHLHGGMGVDVDYPLHRYYLWSKTVELTLGSAAPQLAAVGERMATQAV